MILNIVPAPDLIIRDPVDFYRPLPPEGKAVEDSPYWRRRLRDGDVSLIADTPPAEGEGE